MTATSPVSSALTADARPVAQLLLVHHLGPRQAREVRRALAAGCEVACLTADPGVLSRFGGAVRELGRRALPEFDDGAWVDGSFDLVEAAVARLLALRPAVGRRLVSLTGSQEVDRYLCRTMLHDVGDFLSLLLLAASPPLQGYAAIELERTWPGGLDLAFLAPLADDASLDAPLAAALEKLEFAISRRSRRARLVTASRAGAGIVRLWAFWLGRLRLRATQLPARPFVIRSYAQDWGLDHGGRRRLRNLDFVVDGDVISPQRVMIWAEDDVPASRDRELAERGYAVLRRRDVTLGPRDLLRSLRPLCSSTVLLARLAVAERWWQEPAQTLCSELLLWREVGRRARPRVFLALNDLEAKGVVRTLALRREGCLAVEYEFSSHWKTTERQWVPDYVYGFTVVDAMVVWGPLHREHLENHHAAIGEFWDVGCLWSEHVRLVRDDYEVGRYYRSAVESSSGVVLSNFDAVVGVFDTSTASFFTAADMGAFYAGVAAIAARYPGVLFLCKPKRPVETVFGASHEAAEVGRSISEAPNVVFLDTSFETAAVVGLSDLTINACFTSPAVETIGAGRPSLYFDPTNLFPHAFLRGIPGFVATSGDELAALLEEQLGRSADERESDLRRRFSGVEGHFDGRAITRLRTRIRAVLDA